MKSSHIIQLLCFSSGLISLAVGEFIPTDEWQQVAPDEKIPPGLHVRLNFDTGVREAKLMSPEEKNADNADIVVAIPNEDGDDAGSQLPPYQSLSPDQNEVNQGIENIKSQLTLHYDLLERMAELAHDIEYGTIIVNSALPELVGIILNRDEHSIEFRDTAARALGASLRNNPLSLNTLFESKVPVIPRLLNGLQKEHEPKIQSRLLYVISACLDDNRGIEGYIKSNGGDIVRQVFLQQTQSPIQAITPDSLQIQKKCCDLVQDQLINRQDPGTENKHTKWRESELQKWALLLQQTLVKKTTDSNLETKYAIFQTLVKIKEQSSSLIPVQNDFISWLALENDTRVQIEKEKRNHQSSDKSNSEPEYLSIEEQYFAELKRARHLVFGNPKAQRKHLADDL